MNKLQDDFLKSIMNYANNLENVKEIFDISDASKDACINFKYKSIYSPIFLAVSIAYSYPTIKVQFSDPNGKNDLKLLRDKFLERYKSKNNNNTFEINDKRNVDKKNYCHLDLKNSKKLDGNNSEEMKNWCFDKINELKDDVRSVIDEMIQNNEIKNKNNKSSSRQNADVNTVSIQQNIKLPHNLIVYGIPGCGKSYFLGKSYLENHFDKDNVIRTTFYPDYSNTDFIGQIRPTKDRNNNLDYKVFPGPFTKALTKAFEYENTEKKVALVVEEINRGNAAAIFGDIFQLLDRDSSGKSEYEISNPTVEQYFKDIGLNKCNIYLPSNLYIFATMNTSDQNVFKLDTAFKRRWEFKRMTNSSEKIKNTFLVPVLNVEWEKFIKEINEIISNNDELSGDRQIGKWFVKPEINVEQFANKVLEYIYNDIYKYADKEEIFNVSKYKNFDAIYDAYCSGNKDVFCEEFLNKLNAIQNSTTSSTVPIDNSNLSTNGVSTVEPEDNEK